MPSAGAPGFSLLETIVAMTIVGIAFTVLFGGMSTATRAVERIDAFDRGLEAARSLLDAIDILEGVQPGDEASGTTANGNRWRVETRAFIAPTPSSSLAVVELRLYLETGTEGGTRAWEIDSYALVDTASSPATLQEQMDAILR